MAALNDPVSDASTAKRVFRELLVGFEKGMAAGFPDFGIPPLDPLSVDGDELSSDGIPVKENLVLKLSEIRIVGLSTLKVVELNVGSDEDTEAVLAVVSFDRANVTGKYSLQINGTTTPSASCYLRVRDVSATIPMQTKVRGLDFDSLKDAKIGEVQLQVRSNRTRFDSLDCDERSLGEPLEDLLDLLDDHLLLFFQVQVSTVLQNELQAFIQGEVGGGEVTIVAKGAQPSARGEAAPSSLTGQLQRSIVYTTYDDQSLQEAAIPALRDAFASKETPEEVPPEEQVPLPVAKGGFFSISDLLEKLFDKLLPNVDAYIAKKGFDPYHVTKSPSTTFKMPMRLPVSGGAKIDAPTIYGLSHLTRTGPIDFKWKGLTLTFNIGVDGGLSGGTGVQVWFGSSAFKVAPRASFTLKTIRIRAEFGLMKDKSGRYYALKSLEAADPEVSITFDGLGVITWLLSKLTGLLTDTLVESFKGEILQMIEDAINKPLKKIKLP